MSERRCNKCEWWVRNKNKPRTGTEDDSPFDFYCEKDETYGECRVNPPVVPLVQAENERWYYMFPMTPEDCWCGKFSQSRGGE